MNTSHPVTICPAQADELAGLLDGLAHWLGTGDHQALADLERHLADHASNAGGTFDTIDYLYGTESILATFTLLIAAYQAQFDRPDLDDGDNW